MPPLILFLLSFGCISLLWGKDLNWDLLNYHFYGPYAAINGRVGVDIAPAQIQTFINPFFDFPFYFLYSLGISDKWIAFIMGAFHGFGGYLLYKLSLIYFDVKASLPKNVNLWISIFIGLTGAAGFSIIGSTMIGWEPTILILGALIACLKGLNTELTQRVSAYYWGIAGFVLGVAIGGKVTNGIYMTAIIFSLILVQGVTIKTFKQLVILGLFSIIGILVSSGWWMFLMQHNYESPLFPFFNNIFKSPWAQLDSMRDERFLPKSFMQIFFYPFYWLKINHGIVTELNFRDFRFGIIYILLTCCGLMKLVRFFRLTKIQLHFSQNEKFLIIFFIFSYIIWEFQFSIYRYLLPIEVLSGLIIYILITKLVNSSIVSQLVFLGIFFLLSLTTIYPNWGRQNFDGGDYFFYRMLPQIEKNSLLVMAGDDPLSFVLPYYNKNYLKAIAISNNLISYDKSNLTQQLISSELAKFKGQMYSVTMSYREASLNQSFDQYGLKILPNTCKTIDVKSRQNVTICKLTRG